MVTGKLIVNFKLNFTNEFRKSQRGDTGFDCTTLYLRGGKTNHYYMMILITPNFCNIFQIAASLDKALNIALKQATSVNQHVYKISLVKGL